MGVKQAQMLIIFILIYSETVSYTHKTHRHFYESINGGSPVCIDDDIPFEIPDSWEWCRLEDFCLYGEAPSIKVNECTPETWVLDLEDIVAHAGRISKRITASERPSSSNKYSFDRGSVLYSKLRPYLNKVIVAEEPGCCTTEIIPIRLFAGVSPYYLQNLLMSPLFVEEINNEAYGVKMPRADTKLVKSFLIPVPPILEQLRIVGFLEAQNEKLNTLQQSRKRYKRVLKETPTSLRQQLIQAAIQGLLVPQNPNDEPASKLLERIAEERTARLGKKAAKSMSRIERRGSKTHATYHEIFPDGSEKDISEEIPFDVPDGWEWVRAGAIFDIWSAKRVLQADWQTAGIPFYRAREIAKLAEFGQVNNDLFITEELFQRLAIGGLPHTGDLMITAVGTIGKVYIVKQEDRFYFKDASVISFRNSGGLNSSFLKKLLESDCLQKQMYNKSVGTTVDTITIAKANEYLLPIPPLAEQNRISERLENLLSKIE